MSDTRLAIVIRVGYIGEVRPSKLRADLKRVGGLRPARLLLDLKLP